ncbi:MAG: DNA recombination protein RmuC [Eubacterium sp.]|nr:DNA recombination protein RmuC [Eubacterium sp.]
MEIYLSIAIIVLLIIAIILILAVRPKTDGNTASLEKKLDIEFAKSEKQLGDLSNSMKGLTEKNYEQQIKLMETLEKGSKEQSESVEKAIEKMQESNEKKLEQMRATVDEKLSETLNKRLDSSFKTVSEQLQNVYKSLGEMQELSKGVTENVSGLNRVLTNVKARGTWAEVNLGNILDETIPGMYETNVRTNPKYNGQVEFAVKIPNSDDSSITYLPIDSKFPMEDYARLVESSDKADAAATEAARKSLERTIKAEATAIKQYISIPETTPFAIMYLATEGLYAEVMRSDSGLAEQLQSKGIMVAGPSTITALLNSLAMGFRSIAINKKADEVFKVLGAAKSQYDKFAELFVQMRKRVDMVSKSLDEVEFRNTQIQKNLKTIETLDTTESESILGIE